MLRGIICLGFGKSQSLWVRDRFLIVTPNHQTRLRQVAIPLGQGQVFNLSGRDDVIISRSRNPFGSGTGF